MASSIKLRKALLIIPELGLKYCHAVQLYDFYTRHENSSQTINRKRDWVTITTANPLDYIKINSCYKIVKASKAWRVMLDFAIQQMLRPESLLKTNKDACCNNLHVHNLVMVKV